MILNALSLFCGFFFQLFAICLCFFRFCARFLTFFSVFMDFYCFHIFFIVLIGLDEFGYVFNRYQWISMNFNQFLWIFMDFFMIFMIFIIFFIDFDIFPWHFNISTNFQPFFVRPPQNIKPSILNNNARKAHDILNLSEIISRLKRGQTNKFALSHRHKCSSNLLLSNTLNSRTNMIRCKRF